MISHRNNHNITIVFSLYEYLASKHKSKVMGYEDYCTEQCCRNTTENDRKLKKYIFFKIYISLRTKEAFVMEMYVKGAQEELRTSNVRKLNS